MNPRSPIFKYRIRPVAKGQSGSTAYALNVPAMIQEKFKDTLFSMYVSDDRILYVSGCDFVKTKKGRQKHAAEDLRPIG